MEREKEETNTNRMRGLMGLSKILFVFIIGAAIAPTLAHCDDDNGINRIIMRINSERGHDPEIKYYLSGTTTPLKLMRQYMPGSIYSTAQRAYNTNTRAYGECVLCDPGRYPDPKDILCYIAEQINRCCAVTEAGCGGSGGSGGRIGSVKLP